MFLTVLAGIAEWIVKALFASGIVMLGFASLLWWVSSCSDSDDSDCWHSPRANITFHQVVHLPDDEPEISEEKE